MRFVFASLDHARRKARHLQRLLGRLGLEVSLTRCQATVAAMAGYGLWSELASRVGERPSDLDEKAGLDTVRGRIERQVEAVARSHALDPRRAAGLVLALGLTSKRRSDDERADLLAFEPWPRRLVEGGGGEGVEVFLLQWEERERGWGSRPDGYSIHPDVPSAIAYLADFEGRKSDVVPDEYDIPCSDLVAIRLPEGHPAVLALRDGRARLWGDEARACDADWPREGGGWVRSRTSAA